LENRGDPIHTAISFIGIYQICTVKNGYKKAQKPYDIWVFGVASIKDSQYGCGVSEEKTVR
jgi:hypothetical protein